MQGVCSYRSQRREQQEHRRGARAGFIAKATASSQRDHASKGNRHAQAINHQRDLCGCPVVVARPHTGEDQATKEYLSCAMHRGRQAAIAQSDQAPHACNKKRQIRQHIQAIRNTKKATRINESMAMRMHMAVATGWNMRQPIGQHREEHHQGQCSQAHGDKRDLKALKVYGCRAHVCTRKVEHERIIWRNRASAQKTLCSAMGLGCGYRNLILKAEILNAEDAKVTQKKYQKNTDTSYCESASD